MSENCVHLVVAEILAERIHQVGLALVCIRKAAFTVPDSYEYLGDKVFFAYLILALVGRPRMVVKTDDDIHLGDPDLFGSFLKSLDEQKVDYAGRFVSCSYLGSQGWHVDKCLNTCLHHQGYQFPLPSHYAAGGFGYALSIDGLYACSSWYLGMRSFFAMKTVQLEDIYVGLAIEACNLRSQDCDPLIPRNCGLNGIETRLCLVCDVEFRALCVFADTCLCVYMTLLLLCLFSLPFRAARDPKNSIFPICA